MAIDREFDRYCAGNLLIPTKEDARGRIVNFETLLGQSQSNTKFVVGVVEACDKAKSGS